MFCDVFSNEAFENRSQTIATNFKNPELEMQATSDKISYRCQSYPVNLGSKKFSPGVDKNMIIIMLFTPGQYLMPIKRYPNFCLVILCPKLHPRNEITRIYGVFPKYFPIFDKRVITTL